MIEFMRALSAAAVLAVSLVIAIAAALLPAAALIVGVFAGLKYLGWLQ